MFQRLKTKKIRIFRGDFRPGAGGPTILRQADAISTRPCPVTPSARVTMSPEDQAGKTKDGR